MLRADEFSQKATGMAALFAGLSFDAILFKKRFSEMGMVSVLLGDSIAALVGTFCGKHKVFGLKNKSWEGFAAISVFCWAMSGKWWVGLMNGLMETFAAAYINDNLLLPIATGFMMWAAK